MKHKKVAVIYQGKTEITVYGKLTRFDLDRPTEAIGSFGKQYQMVEAGCPTVKVEILSPTVDFKISKKKRKKK